jgi:pilus assembly protein CpaF
MSMSLIDRVRERLAAESAPLRPNVVAAAIRAESGGVLGDTEVLSNLRMLQTELTGVGILEPLLRAEGTTDVLVTAPDAVWVDDGNGLRRSSIRFADEDAVRRLAQRLASSVGRRLDEAQPWVDGQLTGVAAGQFTVRLHAMLAPIASGGTCLSLRVLRPATQDLATLTHSGAIAGEAATLLDGIIAARLAFLVSGGTGAGKTTLLAATLGEVSPEERIICVEDAAELEPRHPHLVKLVARSANVEGVGEITVRNLMRQALRMRPDRIVVGEVRGAEAFELTRAVNAGCGFLCTVHANSANDALNALVNAALMAGENVTERIVRKVFTEALDLVVHLDRDDVPQRADASVRRQIREISAVLPSIGDTDICEPLFVRAGLGRPLEWTGALPAALEERMDRALPGGLRVRTLVEQGQVGA